MPKESQKTPKSQEVARFMEIKKEFKLTWDQFSAEIGVPKRTIQNYVWETGVLGGTVLRKTHDRFGVSLDWLLTGSGNMYAADTATPSGDVRLAPNNTPEAAQIREPANPYGQDDDDPAGPLFPFVETTDPHSLQDQFYLTAAAIEQSLIQAGDRPGIDYSRLDLYRLAKPFVLERHKGQELAILMYEKGGD
ncbi:MAG: helix-turn-helix transcriptional regulator [Methylococcales bacterium]